MEKTKSVESLKRQLIAAVAMVLVAAIALISATYAWFVANNTVTAKTASISAQSNAPYLKIAKTGENLTTTSATQEAGSDPTDLYPAQWANSFDANGAKANSNGVYQFESAYASASNAATELDDSRFPVGGFDTNDANNVKKYALKQTFDIGTTDNKAGYFKNLKVKSISVNGNDDLKSALCVLIKCGDQWAVYKADNAAGTLLTKYPNSTESEDDDLTITNNVVAQTQDVLASSITAGGKVTVDIYVFYNGAQQKVYTDNIESLKDCGVTVTFTATMVDPNGNEVTGSNAVTTTTTGQEGN